MRVGAVDRIRIPVTGPQREFVESQAKYTNLCAGYGAGKSWALRLKALYRCLANPGRHGAFIASDFGRLSRDVVPGFFDMLDSHEIDHEWIRAAIPGTPSRALLIGKGWLDSVVHVCSMDAVEGIKGLNLAWECLEEVSLFPRHLPGKQETTWSVLISRLRDSEGSNTIDASGTPEGLANWTCDPGRWERAPDDLAHVDTWRRDYRVIRASTGSNPFLPDSFERDLRNNLDPTQIAEKVEGKPSSSVGGSAYYAFSVDRNVRRVRFDPLRGPLIVGVDWNVDPSSAVLCQLAGGILLVFGEISLRDSNSYALAAAILKRAKALGVSLDRIDVYPDAAGRARKTSGQSDFDIFRNAGLARLKYDPSGNPGVSDRLNHVNGALHHGRILVDPSCVGVIRDLSQTARNSEGEIIKTNRMVSHLSDALGYVTMKLLKIRREGFGKVAA